MRFKLFFNAIGLSCAVIQHEIPKMLGTFSADQFRELDA
jgi:hypothetical protein